MIGLFNAHNQHCPMTAIVTEQWIKVN